MCLEPRLWCLVYLASSYALTDDFSLTRGKRLPFSEPHCLALQKQT